jgi:hypothetical protein
MRRRYGLLLQAGKRPQGFARFSAATHLHHARRDATEHEDPMDSRLNALIVDGREHEIALRSAQPRLDATETRALTAPRARLGPRRGVRRFLRRRLATQE